MISFFLRTSTLELTLRQMRVYAEKSGLKPSFCYYKQWGVKKKNGQGHKPVIPLRFSKSGDPAIERWYATEEFMDAVGKLGAGKVVYVSCNPETLARDVRYMKKLGYRAVEAWPVDMFPGTVHVEVVTCLQKVDS